MGGGGGDCRRLTANHIWHLGGSEWVQNTRTSGASIFQYSRNMFEKITFLTISGQDLLLLVQEEDLLLL